MPGIELVVVGSIGLLMVVSAYQHVMKRLHVAVHEDQAKDSQKKAAADDQRWRQDLVHKRMPAIFPVIQRTLGTGNLAGAEALMSPRGLRSLHNRLDGLAAQGFRLEIDQPKMQLGRALFVVDKADDAGDVLWLEVRGKRACYEVSLHDGCLREGSHKDVHAFTELWKLVHGPRGEGVVDEIVPPGGWHPPLCCWASASGGAAWSPRLGTAQVRSTRFEAGGS